MRRILSPIDGGAVARRLAHDRRIDEEAVLEIADRPTVLVEIARIVRIHEDVGADLQLVIDAARALERIGPGSRPVDIGTVMAVAREEVARLARLGDGAGGGVAALGVI